MTKGTLLLGIDGGGTTCRARLCTTDGALLGEGEGGSANCCLGIDEAFAQVFVATRAALSEAGLDESALGRIHACLGLAGANLSSIAAEARDYPLPFAQAKIVADAEIACIGAHRGGDGGIVIIGTGSCAEARIGGQRVRLGGWGFRLGDQGSGAAIGRAAASHALRAQDGLTGPSAVSRLVIGQTFADAEALVIWAEAAKPRDYAALAPAIIRLAADGDTVAESIVRDVARTVDELVKGLIDAGVALIALMGGLAAPIRPWLESTALAPLVYPAGSALDGAIILAHQSLGKDA